MHVLAYKGVELDVCPTCRSVWLDDGEYAKIAALAARPIETNRGRRSSDFEPGDAIDVADFVAEALEGLGSL